MDGVFCDWSNIVSGVPQRSVLGLILLYTGEFVSSVESEVHIYIDGTILLQLLISQVDVQQ